MHHIYTTPAFVIHSSPHGESGKFILLFTRDFGMIGATAQGIRLGVSKLRYHIQDFNFSNISIVRGKEVWRITGAHELEHKKNTIVHLKILKLLKILLHGEEKNEKLFEIIEEIYKTDIEEEYLQYMEYLTVLRIVHNLGYIKEDNENSFFLANFSLDRRVLEAVKNNKSQIIKSINIALKESHL